MKQELANDISAAENKTKELNSTLSLKHEAFKELEVM